MLDGNRQSSNQTHVQAARYSLLSEVVLLLSRTEDLNQLLKKSINKVKWVIDFERCTLALINPDQQTFELRTLLETRRDAPKIYLESVPITSGIPGEAIRVKRPYMITDIAAARAKFAPLPDEAMGDETLTAIISLPLQAYGRVLGAITFSTRREKQFSDEDIQAATAFATHLALAIDHAQQKNLLEADNADLEVLVQQRTTDLALEKERAQEAGAYLGAIIDNLADGLIVLDTSCRITHVNPSLYTMLGLDELTIVGQGCEVLNNKDLITLVSALKSTPDAMATAEVVLHNDRIGKAVATPIHRTVESEAGDIETINVGSVMLIRDITREKEVDRMKTDFIATVSHELRTPLTSILGFAKIIHKRFDETLLPLLGQSEEKKVLRSAKQVDSNLGIIISESERLSALINDVLDISKMEAGQVEWKSEPLDVLNLIERSTASIQSLLDQNPDIELVLDLPEELPTGQGDQDRIMQVIINLLSNAIKFTPTGVITCRAVVDHTTVLVSVQDSGIGIPPEDQEAIFDRFKQVGDHLTDKPQGTGLGLPICKQIIEHHGGSIWVESVQGEGSTFTFTLPTEPIPIEKHNKPIPFDKLVEDLQTRAEHRLPSADTPRILVVDDEAHIRELIRQELSTEGFDIHDAADGLEAIEVAKAWQPDVIILDVMMPKINGFDVAAVLKNDPNTFDIPIIILTIVEDRQRGLKLGVDRYLNKPLEREILVSEIHQLLDQGASQKRVMILDRDSSIAATLADILTTHGYHVAEVDNDDALSEMLPAFSPDLIVANTATTSEHNIIRMLHFSKESRNIAIAVYESEPVAD
ncbi:MAG: ATP-binding protein [Chloroflexota bacterium]